MTASPQSDTFHIPTQDLPPYAPSGTIQFETQGEQIDLHKANPDLLTVADLARVATEIAEPGHHIADASDIDESRIEFGGVAIGAARIGAYNVPAASSEIVYPKILGDVTKTIIAFRTQAVNNVSIEDK